MKKTQLSPHFAEGHGAYDVREKQPALRRDFSRIVFAVAASILAASGCRKGSSQEAAARPGTGAEASQRKAEVSQRNLDVCSLLTATEVGAIMKRKVVAQSSGSGCDYQMDNTERQKQLEKMEGEFKGGVSKAGEGAASSGDASASMDSLMKTFSSAGKDVPRMSQSMAEQMVVTLSVSQDDMSEAMAKQTYSATGKIVRGILAPEKRGVAGAIVVANDISDVGDWAFTTNVASINMGLGFSTRGRILEARKRKWHVTIGATVAPDPGEAALDAELAALARAAIARLPGSSD